MVSPRTSGDDVCFKIKWGIKTGFTTKVCFSPLSPVVSLGYSELQNVLFLMWKPFTYYLLWIMR